MKRTINIYNKKYEKCSVNCVLKLLTTTSGVRNTSFKTKPKSEYFLNSPKNSILPKINQDR